MLKVFFATPMSSFRHEDYRTHYKHCEIIIERLRKQLSLEVYFAGEGLTPPDYDSPEDALRDDWPQLKACDLFFLFYPDRIRSSVLVELGAAMALQKPCFLLIRSISDLPFLVQQANKIDLPDLGTIRIFEYKDTYPNCFNDKDVTELV
jgi:hypothetical protein